MIEAIKDNIDIVYYVIIIGLIIITMYNRIKYLCLKKASELVASVEKDNTLTGKEKFAKVVMWIEEDLPKLFRVTLIKNIIETLVELAYKNSKNYAKNYIKNKTGYDISEIIDNLSNTSLDSSNDV